MTAEKDTMAAAMSRPDDDGLGDFEALDGPWNIADAPADFSFIDFGPIKLPAFEGLQARVEMDEQTQRVGAVSVRIHDAVLQLQLIASPRGSSIWGDIRRALAQNLARQGGNAQAVEGFFDTELIGARAVKDSAGVVTQQNMRFLAVERDGWLLRGAVSGDQALTDVNVKRVNAFVSRIAVERGSEAMGAGSVIALALPQGEAAMGDGAQ